jgi:hypothetical protein
MSKIDLSQDHSQRLTKTEREILDTQAASAAQAHVLKSKLDQPVNQLDLAFVEIVHYYRQ